VIQVEVFPQAMDHKVFPLYAGLFDLEDRNEIELRLESVNRISRRLPARSETLFARITDTKLDKSLLACFDMVDWSAPARKEQLEVCDIYFKRSFRSERYMPYPTHLANKIRPFGLGSSFMSPSEHDHVRRSFLLIRNGLADRFRSVSVRNVYDYVVSLGSRSNAWRSVLNHAAYARDWQVDNALPKQDKVLYQSRVWEFPGRENSEKMLRFNDARAQTVRLLRAEFGNRFVGGLIPNNFAKKHYPDYLTNLPTKRGQYIELVRECLVAVSTVGLNNSNPHKLAEYLAASCCIVSEPLRHELPDELIVGRNMLLFDSPESCVEACSKLLSDNQRAQNMRDANNEYYSRSASPAGLMRNRIADAIADL